MTLLLWAGLCALACYFYRRCVSLQRQITQIVREDAIRHAEPPAPALAVLVESTAPTSPLSLLLNPRQVKRADAA